MSIPIISPKAARERKKLTCVTCALKRCVGRCQFVAVDRPQQKAA